MKNVWLVDDKPALILAPMEGVTDAPMRALLTELRGFTHCVTEFLRVSQDVPPEYVFFRHARELSHGSMTPSGIPILFQLLGGDPVKMALAAQVAIECGAVGIDLNFGCPAPTVNRHDGGATLLKFPRRIFEIVKAVRTAVPQEFPVSAKLRLGWDSVEAIFENAQMAIEGGASWITVHGRTKVQGYRPPAYWEPIGRLRQISSVPIVANGEIWSLEDFKRCREQTGCIHFMIGRGALANPHLPAQIAKELGLEIEVKDGFPGTDDWRCLGERFIELGEGFATNPNYVVRRLKQWFKLVDLRHPRRDFQSIKTMESVADFRKISSHPEFMTS